MEATYDLGQSPATHDFVNWLARAEAKRIERDAPGLDIQLKRGKRMVTPRDFAYDTHIVDWRMKNLLTPLAWLLPSVRSVTITDHGQQDWGYGNPGRAMPPILKAPAHAVKMVQQWMDPKAVIIHIRESKFEPARNSHIWDWHCVAGWLRANKYEPMFIPDAECEMHGSIFDGAYFRIIHPAVHNIAYKLAVMQCAHANLMINSGAWVMAMYSHARVIGFKGYVPGVPCCSTMHMTMSGFMPPEKWEGKDNFFEDDTAVNIIPKLEQLL